MRVYERGVGETRSCGTGMVAAAAAVLRHRGQADGALVVRALGGQAQVELASGMATLTGPAVLVAAGRLDDRWWRTANDSAVDGDALGETRRTKLGLHATMALR